MEGTMTDEIEYDEAYVKDLYERLEADPDDMGLWAELQEMAEREGWDD